MDAVHQGEKWTDLPANHPGREFKEAWSELAIIDEGVDPLLVVDDRKVVVPPLTRKEILQMLHLPRVGVMKTREAAH